MTFFSTADGARIFGGIAWLSSQLAQHFLGWASDGLDTSAAPEMRSMGRRFEQQAGWWKALVPESVLLQDQVLDGPVSAEVAAILTALKALPPGQRLAACGLVVDTWQEDVAGLAEAMTTVGDAPALRVAGLVGVDFEDFPAVSGALEEVFVSTLQSARPLTGQTI